MSVRGSRVKTPKVACDICGLEFTKPGLVGHKRFVHNEQTETAQFSDVETKVQIAALNDELTASKAALSSVESELISTKTHLSQTHQSLEESELRIKQLADALAEAQSSNESPEFRKAILADWLSGMTIEAWEEIGKQNEFIPENLGFVCQDCGKEVYRGDTGEWYHRKTQIEESQNTQVQNENIEKVYLPRFNILVTRKVIKDKAKITSGIR